jgi:NitT/TauT family transport system permease protein
VAILPAAFLAGLLVAWHIAAVNLGLPEFILPTPGRVLEVGIEQREMLFRNAGPTIQEALLGFLFAALFGIAVGVGVAESRTFARSTYPILVASQSVPKLVLAPLFTLWLGFGLTPKVLIAFLIAVFPIILGTVVGIQSVKREMIDLGRSMGMSYPRILLSIKAPAAGPSIFGGLKVGATFAVVGAVTSEFLGADAGLGRLTQVAAARLNTPLLFADLALLAVIGVATYGLVAGTERLLFPWNAHREDRYAGASF